MRYYVDFKDGMRGILESLGLVEEILDYFVMGFIE